MSFLSRTIARAWFLLPLGAIGFLLWADARRLQRVNDVSGIAGGDAVVDTASPTGYAGGLRWLIAPEHNNESYRWMAETQQMFARREWRIRRIDFENAPFGHAGRPASLYRWWLGLVAWCDHAISGRPVGLSVERAALYADPLLHLLLLVGATVFAARQFGAGVAALLSAGLALLFPLAAAFLPGAPDDLGLAVLCAMGSVLPLLAAAGVTGGPGARSGEGVAGTTAVDTPPRGAGRFFVAAGVAGGVGLWLSVGDEGPVLVGIVLGALGAAWLTRARSEGAKGVPHRAIALWRLWSLAGAATSLLAYLVEFNPAETGLQPTANHPLLALAWLGSGELIARFWAWTRGGNVFRGPGAVGLLGYAGVAIAALPVVAGLNGTTVFHGGDPLLSRLTSLPNGIVAGSFKAWILRDGFSPVVWAAGLPLLVLGPALGLLVGGRLPPAGRTGLVVALGPVLTTLGVACCHLRGWSMLEGMLLVLAVPLLAAGFAARAHRWRWTVGAATALVLAPGAIQLLPSTDTGGRTELTRLEAEGVVERDLAHWLAARTGPGAAVVLAPPFRTTSLCFHGGIRGIGTFDRENRDGLAATIRIAGARSRDMAQGLINERGITHIVLPSWDRTLDDLARLGSNNSEQSLLSALQGWAHPLWLRPVPYRPPAIGGWEDQSVVVFEVVDEQGPAMALSRLVEYFIDMDQLDLAASAGDALRKFPVDLNALVALGQLETARKNPGGFSEVCGALLPGLAMGSGQTLPWDRRVSLAIVLAQGKRLDLAQGQVRRCLAELDEARLRSLSTSALYRLQVLAKALRLNFPDDRSRQLALALLPPELRQRL